MKKSPASALTGSPSPIFASCSGHGLDYSTGSTAQVEYAHKMGLLSCQQIFVLCRVYVGYRIRFHTFVSHNMRARKGLEGTDIWSWTDFGSRCLGFSILPTWWQRECRL